MGQRNHRAMISGLIGISFGLFLYACGEIGGSGQCGGVESNGVCTNIESITPIYLDEEIISVDVIGGTDCDNDVTTVDPESFTTHQADVDFNAISLLPDETPGVPTFVTLTQYTIDYSLDPGPSSGPSIPQQRYNQSLKLETGSGATVRVIFFSLDLKEDYVNSGGNPSDYPSYTATYTFTGTDAFGEGIAVQGRTQFEIGNFNNCSSS